MTKILSAIALILVCSASLAQEKQPDKEAEAQRVNPFEDLFTAIENGDVDGVKAIIGDKPHTYQKLNLAQTHQIRGQKRFYSGDIKGSIEDFDAYLEILPEDDPKHWQRGISYYYADRFADGKAQFERHQTFNTQDVENAVWHFLCAVRAPGGSLQAARKNLIPISKDTRVPMKEVHQLFAGTGTPEAVLAAAKGEQEKGGKVARNAMLYAHLYLGLFYEATGKEELMKKHISQAAGEFKMDHYMGMTAQIHAKLRGIKTASGE